MRKTIKESLRSVLLIPALTLAIGVALPVGAAVLTADQAAAQNPKTEIEKGVTAAGGGSGSDGSTLTTMIGTAVNVLLLIIGAVSVIMIIYGGFRYVTSGGDSSAVTSAKNTILYAVVGLIVALLAYAIVGWVLAKFGGE